MQLPLKYRKKRSMRRAWAQVPCLMAPPGCCCSATGFCSAFFSGMDMGSIVADAESCRNRNPSVVIVDGMERADGGGGEKQRVERRSRIQAVLRASRGY